MTPEQMQEIEELKAAAEEAKEVALRHLARFRRAERAYHAAVLEALPVKVGDLVLIQDSRVTAPCLVRDVSVSGLGAWVTYKVSVPTKSGYSKATRSEFRVSKVEAS